ncbi:aminodeoxychorismate lyase [Moraxella bovoculi]|uniref:aminotransferase class IV n=1 Tax=Moraxella bovoculi TaxID=386891 RepID=UPI0009BAB28A|nr:aminotransferase class IV [Moraxella bovoculi]NSM11109.1 aminodeoxychorismate lyase [Moraxella bovoculi]
MTTTCYLLRESDRQEFTKCDGIMDERGLAYGDGFFSTVGAHDGRVLFADGHRERLVRSAERLELSFDVDGVMAALYRLAKDIQEGILKIIVTRAPQEVRGYGYLNQCAQVFIKSTASRIYDGVEFVSGVPCQKVGRAVCLDEKVSLRTSRFIGLKLISSHEQVFIHRALLDHQESNSGIVEGLIKSASGDWVGGTTGNVCYCIDGVWYTPPITDAGVDGVMRRTLMLKFSIKVRGLTDDDLKRISGMFFCNAVRGIMPIDALIIDGDILQLSQHIHILPSNSH